MGVEILVPLGFFASVVAVVVGLPIARAKARAIERSGAQPPLPAGEVIARLERIEQGVEAMATEVERISEGQRFTTKLLSETRLSETRAHALPPGPVAVAEQPAGAANDARNGGTSGTPSAPPPPAPAAPNPDGPGGETVLVDAARRP